MLHHRTGVGIAALIGARLTVAAAECVAVAGNSGSGKSLLMRMIRGIRRADAGRILVDGTDIVTPVFDPATVA